MEAAGMAERCHLQVQTSPLVRFRRKGALALAAALAAGIACGGAPSPAVTPPSPAASSSASDAPPSPSAPAADARTVDASTAVHPFARNVLWLNVEALRAHPLAARAKRLLAGATPWRELAGALDPVASTRWVVYTGTSFRPHQRSVFLVGYSADDGAVDLAIDALATKKDGAPFDTG